MTGGPDNRFLYLVEDHGEVLLRAARVLCGDWAQAEDLLQTALSRSLVRWEAGLSDEECVIAMQQEVVAACLDTFPDHHDMTFRSTSEPPGSLLAQLHELDPTAHAALVAMYYLELTAWQAADAIGSVASHTSDIAERCLAWLDTPEETFRVQLDTELGPTPPSPADRLEWVTRAATPESHTRHGQSAAPLGRLTPRVAAVLTIALLSTSLAAALVLNAGGKDDDRHESTPQDSVEVDTVPTLPERVPAARTLSGTTTAPSPSATTSATPSPGNATTARPPQSDSAAPPPAQQPTTRPPSPTSSTPRPPTPTSPKPKPTPTKTTRPTTPPPTTPTTPPPSTSPTPTTSPSDPGTGGSSATATGGATSTNTPTGMVATQTGSIPVSP